ncbi:MAG: AAA family ATPase [Thiohalospira sp.]
MTLTAENRSTPRIEYLRVQNYRALQNVELKHITPLTVLLGPNGSGKSTVFVGAISSLLKKYRNLRVRHIFVR